MPLKADIRASILFINRNAVPVSDSVPVPVSVSVSVPVSVSVSVSVSINYKISSFKRRRLSVELPMLFNNIRPAAN